MSDIAETGRPPLTIVPDSEIPASPEADTPPNPLSEVAQRLSSVEGVDPIKLQESLLSLQSRLKDRLEREIADRALSNSASGANLSLDPAKVAEEIFGELEVQRVASNPNATPLEYVQRRAVYTDAYQSLAQGDFAQVAAAMQALGVANGRGITNPQALEALGRRNVGGFSDYDYYADAGIDYGGGRTAKEARDAMKKEGEEWQKRIKERAVAEKGQQRS